MARPKKIEETEGSVLNVREADVKQPEGQDTSVSGVRTCSDPQTY